MKRLSVESSKITTENCKEVSTRSECGNTFCSMPLREEKLFMHLFDSWISKYV